VRRTAAALLVAALAASCTSAPGSEAPAPNAAASPSTAPGSTDAATDAPVADPESEPVRMRFAGRVTEIPAAVRREMRGTTWKPGCPVPLSDLRLLRFNHWGFDGVVKRGPMVVHEDVADDVLWAFRQLFDARFPIRRVALAREFVPEEFEPRISSRRSVTAAFNCRTVVTPLGPGESFSQHAYGLAIDINPVQNPFVLADGFVRNRMARPYVDRSRDLPGMIRDGDGVVRSFEAIGWSWGGRWNGGKDYMHFSRTGR